MKAPDLQTRRPRVCVVLLNWNGRDDTLACLESLKASTYSPLEIVIVDQGSEDGLVETVRQREPQVEVFANQENLGFAGGNNQGMRYGLEQGADYLLLLNNDTVVDEACIGELVSAAEANPVTGALGPKIYQLPLSDRIWSYGGIVDWGQNVASMRGFGQVDRGQFDSLAKADFLSGCAVMVRREVVEAVGLLDEEYSPIYYEDTDWGMRIRAAGYENVVVPSAKIWHKESMSMGGSYNPTSKYLMGHHAVVFMRKYARCHQWAKWFVFAVLSLPALYLVRAFQGKGVAVRAKAVGIWDGLRGRPVPPDVFDRRW